MADRELIQKAAVFAKDIMALCTEMKVTYKETVAMQQLFRAGTSAVGSVYEAQHAQSRDEAVAKLELAQEQREAAEALLELLFKAGCVDESAYQSIQGQCDAIKELLTAALETTQPE